MSQVATPTLPQELIDKIIDELAYEGLFQSLKACALVSKSFSIPARRYLFSKIRIFADTREKKTASRLLQVLQRMSDVDPSFGMNLSGNLRIEDGSMSPAVPRILRIMGLTGRAFATSRNTSKIHKLLELFANKPLSNFTLMSWQYMWTSHNAQTDERIVRILMNPSLKTIDLAYVDVPQTVVRDIFHSPGLKRLVLNNVSFASLEIPGVNLNQKPVAKIEYLELREISFPVILTIVHSLPTLHTLWSLHVTVPDSFEFRTALKEILLCVASSLRDLGLMQVGSDISWTAPICLGRLTALEYLQITLSISSSPPTPDLQSLTNLLSADTPSLLKFIAVDFLFDAYNNHDLSILLSPREEWSRFYQALNSPMLGNLEALTFNIKPNPARKMVTTEEWRKLDPMALLPITESSSIDLSVIVEKVTIIYAYSCTVTIW